MANVIRLSKDSIDYLEEFRKNQIESNKVHDSALSVEYYKNASYPELVRLAIICSAVYTDPK